MKKVFSCILVILMLFTVAFSFSSCGDDYSAQDLQDAKGRVFSGNGSKSDKRMVKGFYEWKANQ